MKAKKETRGRPKKKAKEKRVAYTFMVDSSMKTAALKVSSKKEVDTVLEEQVCTIALATITH